MVLRSNPLPGRAQHSGEISSGVHIQGVPTPLSPVQIQASLVDFTVDQNARTGCI